MTADVLVIGAGPAGASTARLLAAWGHRVLVIHRAGGDSGRLAESIPPSADRVLAAIGALGAIADAGFLPWRGNTVWWAGEAPRVEAFPPGATGYQVVRRAFDRCLRDLAIKSGAEIREGRVRDVLLGASPSAVVEFAEGSTTVSARILIDASGRAGVIARQGLRVQDEVPHTIALAAVWRAIDPWPIDDETHTLVASYPDGWAWSVPTAAGERQFAVMVDPSRTKLARGGHARDVYLAELAKVGPFSPILARASLVDGPWGADASVYSASSYSGDGFLLVGDAASAIDPLSSFGVKKALASGWLAAVATHTALTQPDMAKEAFEFFNRREHAVVAGARRQAARFAAEAAAETAHPFWSARSDAAGDAEFATEPDTSALATDPSVLAAFADLRTRSSIHFAIDARVQIVPRPAVRGREIVMEDQLVLPAWPDGIRFLRGVDLVALLRLAPAHRDVGELYESAGYSAGRLPLPDFLGALSLLIAAGALRHESSRD